MPRETRSSRGIGAPGARRISAAQSWSGPVVNTQVRPRAVPMEENPMAGMNQAGRAFAGQMLSFSRDMAAFFGQATDSLMTIAKVGHAEEMAKIERENDELAHQARLDYYRGEAPKSDAAAYRFERERLERMTVEAEARATFLKSRGFASGGRSGGGGGGSSGGSNEEIEQRARAQAQAQAAARIRAAVSRGGSPVSAQAAADAPTRPPVPALPYLPVQDVKLTLGSSTGMTPLMAQAPSIAAPQDWGDTAAATPVERAVRAGGPSDLSNATVEVDMVGRGSNRQALPKLSQVSAHDIAEPIEMQIKSELLPAVTPDMSIEEVYAARDEILGRRLQGAPDWVVGQIADIVSQSTRDAITNRMLSVRQEYMDERSRTARARIFNLAVEGQPMDPNSFERFVMELTPFEGDDREARLGAARAFVNGTVQRISEAGDVDAYVKAMQTLSPTFRSFPEETAEIRQRLTAAYSESRTKRVQEVSTEIDTAIATGDVNTVTRLITENIDLSPDRGFSGAHKKAVSFLQKQAEERAKAEHRERVFTGFMSRQYMPTGKDWKIVEEMAGERAMQYFEAQDTASLAQLSENLQEIPGDFAKYANFVLTDTSAIDALMTTGPDGSQVPSQRLVAIERMYELAKRVSPTVLAKSLNETARTVISMIGEDTSTPFADRVNQALQTVARNEGRLTTGDLTRDIRAAFPEATSAQEAQQMLTQAVTQTVADTIGGTLDEVTVRYMQTVVNRAQIALMRQMTLSGGKATPESVDMAVRSALGSTLPVPVGTSTFGLGYSMEMIEVPKQVLHAWGSTPSMARASMEKFVGNAPVAREATMGAVPENVSLSSTDPRLQRDREAGWLQVTDSDDMGMPVFIAPGASFEFTPPVERDESQDRRAIINSRVASEVVETFMPTDPQEFRERLADMNDALLPTGYQFLPYDENASAFYLAYRPVSDVELSEIDKFRSTEGVGPDRLERALDESLRTVLDRAGDISVIDHKSHLGRIVRESIDGLAEQGLVPKSLGLTVRVPETFEDANEAVEWLEKAHETYRINYALARPKPNDPTLPPEKLLVDFVQSVSGSLDKVHRVYGNDEKRVIGAGLDFDREWVQESLRALGYDQKQIRDLRDGKRELRPGEADLLNIESVRLAEDEMRRKLDVRNLPRMPFDAYKIMVSMVQSDDKFLSKEVVEAFNSGNIQGVAEAIAQAVPKSGDRDYRQYMTFLRRQMADVFSRAMGL